MSCPHGARSRDLHTGDARRWRIRYLATTAHAGQRGRGSLQLAAAARGVHITGQVSGLQPNSTHGIHSHEHGNCSTPGAKKRR
jgi:Cu-Zn family superoxide dismutase